MSPEEHLHRARVATRQGFTPQAYLAFAEHILAALEALLGVVRCVGPGGVEIALTVDDFVGQLNQARGERDTALRELRQLHERWVWQPIETAPHDGTDVLLLCKDGTRAIGDFTDGAWWCLDVPLEPTHWMPAPDAPLPPE